ncbi:MAG: hypothetical protein D6711_09885 [Chloroflexi bacterium]|nr:MAG: hypothetical protein D6711_09885 [Chloroflexota bacterium]
MKGISVLTVNQLLLQNERFIGDYNVEIARWSNGKWSSTIPTLYAILTDHRLILQPHARKLYEPAIIPAHYILHIVPLRTPTRFGVVLTLKTEQRVALLIPTHQKDEIIRNLRTIALPGLKENPRQLQIQCDMQNVRKMINYFAHW